MPLKHLPYMEQSLYIKAAVIRMLYAGQYQMLITSLNSTRRLMPLVTGLLRERVGHLLVALLVTHSLKVATATSVSLTVKQPKSVFDDVVIVDSAKYHLIAILNCTGTQLQANVNKEESLLYGNGSLEVQLERGSKPNEYFLLPNNSGKTLPKGEYQVDVLCSIPCAQETKSILVSVVTSATATDSKVPYFIDSPRTVNISASTPPGSIVTYFKAEFPGALQSGRRDYAVHEAFSRAPFQIGLSGDLVLERSLLAEGTLPRYDIVIMADQEHHEAWTLTTIIIRVCEVTSASPLLGSFEGGATVTLEVSSTCNLTSVGIMMPACTFGSQSVPATVVNSMQLTCVVPRMDMPGNVRFRFEAMTAGYGNLDYENMFSAVMPPPAEASPTPMPMDCATARPTAASTGNQYAFTALIAVVAVLAVLFLLSLLVIIFLVMCVARLNKQKRAMAVQGEKQAIVSPQFANVSLDDQLKSPTANSSTAFL